jgi:hypothetical protein
MKKQRRQSESKQAKDPSNNNFKSINPLSGKIKSAPSIGLDSKPISMTSPDAAAKPSDSPNSNSPPNSDVANVQKENSPPPDSNAAKESVPAAHNGEQASQSGEDLSKEVGFYSFEVFKHDFADSQA